MRRTVTSFKTRYTRSSGNVEGLRLLICRARGADAAGYDVAEALAIGVTSVNGVGEGQRLAGLEESSRVDGLGVGVGHGAGWVLASPFAVDGGCTVGVLSC